MREKKAAKKCLDVFHLIFSVQMELSSEWVFLVQFVFFFPLLFSYPLMSNEVDT